MDTAGDQDDHPAPAPLRVVVLLQGSQLPQLLLVGRHCLRYLTVAGDDHLQDKPTSLNTFNV